MTIELTMILYVVLLLGVQILTQTIAGERSYGVGYGVGARDNKVETNIYHGRATRALQNLIEAMLLFVPIVLVLHLAGVSNSVTLLATKIFVAARIGFFILYMLGTPWLRTILWAIGTMSIIALFLQAF